MRKSALCIGVLLVASTTVATPVSADEFLPAPPVLDATLFVDQPMSLASVDLFSGTALGNVGNAFGLEQMLVADLADAGQLAFDAQVLAEQVQADAQARRRAEEQRMAAAARAAATAAQTQVGPDGCPTSTPPRTLRGGAEEIGAHALCVRSVAMAPTAEAAIAIKFTFANLGVPYSRPNRMSADAFDCSSYVMRAYESAGVPTIVGGWAPSTRQIAPYPGYSSYPWLVTVPYEQALPGDLLLTPPMREDGGGHVMMQLSDGFMIHTAAIGDVSNVTTVWPEHRIQVVRRVVV